MRIIDPGHIYGLAHLDGDGEEILTFVKRQGIGYPGNIGAHPGTNLQEVYRALIDRVKYLDAQIRHPLNAMVLGHSRACISLLEARAAERHERNIPSMGMYPELVPTCKACGHVECDKHPEQLR